MRPFSNLEISEILTSTAISADNISKPSRFLRSLFTECFEERDNDLIVILGKAGKFGVELYKTSECLYMLANGFLMP